MIMWWALSAPLGEIGLTDLPKSGDTPVTPGSYRPFIMLLDAAVLVFMCLREDEPVEPGGQ